jgi:hypothetical protein
MPSGIWLTMLEGDEVAILPRYNSRANEVLDIQKVSEAGSMLIHLANGQIFSRIGGASLDGLTFIVPATEQHRAALKAK